MKNHTDIIIPNISNIVSSQFCKKMALKTGFVKRSTNRLNGYEFVKAMILGSGNDTLLTYKKRIIHFNPNGKMSLSGLAQKINQPSAEDLMFQVFTKCLINLYEKVTSNIKNISRILIQDSTCIPLNKKLRAIYSGSGGHHKNAGIKIDCIYDYTNEAILDVQHHARTVPDANNGCAIFKHLQPNDLVLRDLGYFKIENFKKIEEQSAYYVSRLKSELLVYLRSEDEKALTFIEFLKKKLRNTNFLDCISYIGKGKQKVRLIVNKLPDEVVNQRLRRANRESQVRRTTLSDSKRAFLSYTILITNLPQEMASAKDILMLYGIRWRIELVFKEWKSQICIGNITGTNIHRIRCLIYGRLCLLLILNKLTSYISKKFLEINKEELSIKKTLDYLLEKENLLKIFLKKGVKKILEKALKEDYQDLSKGKRKKRKTTLEKLMNSKLAA
jgi:Transposase DDE domain